MLRSCLWIVSSFALLLIAGFGCSKKAEEPTVNVGGSAEDADRSDRSSALDADAQAVDAQSTADAPTVQPEPVAEPEMPQVVMSQEHAASVNVKVGEELPAVTLPDLQGEDKPLLDLLGERLTVVFFWSSESPYTLAELEDLGLDVAIPYADQGLNVVGINVGDSPETALEKAEQADVNYPVLLDEQGSYLSRVSKGKPPMTFLLDSKGKVLWLDIEYTRQTRRALDEAIQFVLGKAPGA